MKLLYLFLYLAMIISCGTNSTDKQLEELEAKNKESQKELDKSIAELNNKTTEFNEACDLFDKGSKELTNKNYNRADALFTMAIEKFSNSHEISEKYATCYFSRGITNLNLKNIQNACNDLTQYKSIYDNNANIHSPYLEDFYKIATERIKENCSEQ